MLVMKWWRIFLIVSAGALVGLVMGSLFGFIAGQMLPDFFARRAGEWEAIRYATVLGGMWGVKLGGALAAFGVAVQMYLQTRKRDAGSSTVPKL